MSEGKKITYFSLFFVITTSFLCHFFFSWIGFNPTDDGFILSLSRRILDGEIPHRDFIFIRPALSPIIHTPFVLFGGDYTFWFSRYFIWIELSSTACIWTYIITRRFFNIAFEKHIYFFLTLACFVFSVYTAFIMPHTTYDAVFLYSLGLLICLHDSRLSILAGCFVIGLAYLCRQNYALMVPVTLIVFGYWKKIKYWLAAALPAILYAGVMFMLDGGNDLYTQLVSVSGKFHGGFKIFVSSAGFWLSVPAGYLLISKFFVHEEDNSEASGVNVRLIVTSVLIIPGLLLLNSDVYPLIVSFCFFGFVLGMVSFMLIKKNYEYFKYGFIILSAAWCTSISIGMSYPALFAGQMFIFAFVLLTGMNKYNYLAAIREKTFLKFFYAAAVVLMVLGFTYARLINVYRDKEAGELNYEIGSVLQGTKKINTNQNTYRFLKDLQEAVLKAGEREYCILPDVSCYWVKSDKKNPLPISWANKTEIGNELLLERLKNSMSNNDRLVIILEKVYANSLHKGFLPLERDDRYSPVVYYVVSNYRKLDETEYFELFSKK